MSGRDSKKPDKIEMMPLTDVLAEEIGAEEALDPEAFYEAKLVSYKIGREMGFSHKELEEALGIRLRPEDRHRIDAGNAEGSE